MDDTKPPSLAGAEGALLFVTALMQTIARTVAETKSFSPFAIVFTTCDPTTGVPFESPRAVPLNAEILISAATPEQRQEIQKTWTDYATFLRDVARTAAERGKAVGAIVASSGNVADGVKDESTGEVAVGSKTRAILLVMEHQRFQAKAWLAYLSETPDSWSVGEFLALDALPEGPDFTPILPMWN